MTINHASARDFAIEQVMAGNGHALSKAFADHFKTTRMTATRTLKKLVDEGWIATTGTTRPLYSLGMNRRILNTYRLPGVDEHLCWTRDFAPYLDLPKNVLHIVEHGFTEMLNNANDHSEGTMVSVLATLKSGIFRLIVLDNGVGIFKKIATAMNLPDNRLAILELAKGKFTTDPSRHSGEGIFFTSRMFDHFQIEANDLQYTHSINHENDWLFENDHSDDPELHKGTFVHMAIPCGSELTAKEVFDKYSGGENYGFEKTIVPVRLARVGNENLISRSQAKRLVARVDGFKTVIFDFTDIPEIGQAFADEVFRVFANNNREINLIPSNANEAVMQMIRRAQAAQPSLSDANPQKA